MSRLAPDNRPRHVAPAGRTEGRLAMTSPGLPGAVGSRT